MEVTPEEARRRAFGEATDWFILLQEDPDDQELLRRLEEWRAASPLNAEAWLATRHTAEVATAMTPGHADDWMPAVAARRARPMQRPRSRRPVPWRRVGLSVVVAAAAACAAVALAPSMLLRLDADHMTETAEVRVLELQDGSKVTLAPSSAVTISFTSGERRLDLLAGQAFFQVTPNPARPFRVKAAAVETSVLGTSFDVRLDSDGVTVAVQEGVVQVDSSTAGRKASERLAAGETVRVSSRGTAERSAEAPQLVAAWRQGQLLSQDRPLREAVDQLRRYWGGTIILADDALGARTVTGVYNLGDPEEALRGIVQTHGGKVRRLTPWVLLVTGS